MANFNWVENLPLIIFGVVLTIAVIIFLIGAFFFLFFKDPEKTERGKRILIKSIYWFFSVLLIAIVFFTLSWLLNREKAPSPSSGEFPASPIGANFPPLPQTIQIGGIHFNGPFWFGNTNILTKEAIYLILCKEDENYDIMYIGYNLKESQLLTDKEYECWTEACPDYDNLYVAIFWIPNVSEKTNIKTEVRQVLDNTFLPPCPLPEE